MGVRLPSVTTVQADSKSMVSALREIVNALRQMAAGRGNYSGTVTLTANATTTVVENAAIGRDAAIILDEGRTANAAAAKATTWVSAQDTGTFTLTHANNAQIDRTFRWVAIGG